MAFENINQLKNAISTFDPEVLPYLEEYRHSEEYGSALSQFARWHSQIVKDLFQNTRMFTDCAAEYIWKELRKNQIINEKTRNEIKGYLENANTEQFVSLYKSFGEFTSEPYFEDMYDFDELYSNHDSSLEDIVIACHDALNAGKFSFNDDYYLLKDDGDIVSTSKPFYEVDDDTFDKFIDYIIEVAKEGEDLEIEELENLFKKLGIKEGTNDDGSAQNSRRIITVRRRRISQ